MEYQFTSSDDGGFGSIWNGYKDEEILEKMEVGKNAKECFAEMGEYRKMQDRLWGQMMHLDSLEAKKIMKELRNRYCKTTFHEIMEHYSFKRTFEGIIFPFTCTPLDHSLTLEKTHSLSSCTAASDILLLRQPVERLATSSSLTLDLFFLGAISVSRAMILKLGCYKRG